MWCSITEQLCDFCSKLLSWESFYLRGGTKDQSRVIFNTHTLSLSSSYMFSSLSLAQCQLSYYKYQRSHFACVRSSQCSGNCAHKSDVPTVNRAFDGALLTLSFNEEKRWWGGPNFASVTDNTGVYYYIKQLRGPWTPTDGNVFSHWLREIERKL